MPIGKIEFYNIPVSRARGERPMFTSIEALAQYKTGEAQKVKMTFDPVQSRTFDLDWVSDGNLIMNCNIAMLTYINKIDDTTTTTLTLPFWVNAVRQNTAKQSSFTFDFEFLPTTILMEGVPLGGIWERTPIKVDTYLHEPVMDDVMAFKRKIRFSIEDNGSMGTVTRNMNGVTETFGLCWVQITSTVKDAPLVSDAPDGKYDLSNVDQSSYTVYGFPCLYYTDRLDLCRERMALPEKGLNDGSMTYVVTNPITGETTNYDRSFLLHDPLPHDDRPDPAFWTDLGGGYYLGNNLTANFDDFGRVRTLAYIVQNNIHLLGNQGDDHPSLPSLDDVINNPDQALGIPASSITDISISTRCPYALDYYDRVFTDWQGYGWSGVPFLLPWGEDRMPNTGNYGDNPYKYELRATYKQNIAGTNVEGATVNNYLLYYSCVDSPAQKVKRQPDGWHNAIMVLSEAEHDLGSLTVKDENGAVMAEIPVEYAYHAADQYQLNFQWKCWNDTAGVYTMVRIVNGQDEVITEPITLNEGKLPYVGDSWMEYRVYDMANDRQEVNNAKTRAMVGFVAGVGEAVATGGMTMAMARVGAASKKTEKKRDYATIMGVSGSILSAGVNTALDMWSADMDQALKEKRMREGPGTGYLPSYGYTYLAKSVQEGAGIYLQMPANFSQNKYDQYHEQFGYPADGYSEVDFQEGYWQGRLTEYNNDLLPTGVWTEGLITDFATGIHIKKIV